MAGAGRAWGAAAGLALLTTVSPAVHPLLLIAVPLGLLVLAMPPPRPALIAFAAALAAVLLVGGAAGTLWYAERGWALVVGAWFVVAVVLWPSGDFIHRALAAIGAAAVSAVLVYTFQPVVFAELDWAVGERLRSTATWLTALSRGGAVALPDAAGAAVSALDLPTAVYRWAELNAWLYPALLGLSTLGGLGLAWWAYWRIGFRAERPLGRLREFRFRAELAWLVVLGALVALLAGSGSWQNALGATEAEALRVGSNLLVFMGALYLLRGAAVLLTMASGINTVSAVLAALAVVFLMPVVLATTLLVGLTDTWVDLRARWRAAEENRGRDG